MGFHDFLTIGILSGFFENPRDSGFFQSRDFYPRDSGFF